MEDQVTTQVTNEQIAVFRSIAEQFLRSMGNPQTLPPDESRFVEAVYKMFNKTKKKFEHYSDKINAIRRAHSLTDPKTKKLLMTGNQYDYTKEAADKVEEEIRQLQGRKIDIRPEYIGDEDIPEDLKFEFQMQNGAVGVITDYEARNAFKRFVIKPNGIDEIEEDEDE